MVRIVPSRAERSRFPRSFVIALGGGLVALTVPGPVGPALMLLSMVAVVMAVVVRSTGLLGWNFEPPAAGSSPAPPRPPAVLRPGNRVRHIRVPIEGVVLSVHSEGVDLAWRTGMAAGFEETVPLEDLEPVAEARAEGQADDVEVSR